MKLRRDSEQTKPPTKKRDWYYSVTIDARFASEIQYTVAKRVLDQFLTTWKEEAESRHKKNSIAIIPGK